MENQNTNMLPIERRAAIRINCQRPIRFKVCKDETVTKIMEGYTHNISKDGLRCLISENPPVGSILWLELDADALNLCEELEKRAIILQHGILGKVIWSERTQDNKFDVGMQFVTRELKN